VLISIASGNILSIDAEECGKRLVIKSENITKFDLPKLGMAKLFDPKAEFATAWPYCRSGYSAIYVVYTKIGC